jgi:hypothetical protein
LCFFLWTFFCYNCGWFCCKRNVFCYLVHYGSKSGSIGEIRFCYKQTVFCYFGTLWKQKWEKKVDDLIKRLGMTQITRSNGWGPGIQKSNPRGTLSVALSCIYILGTYMHLGLACTEELTISCTRKTSVPPWFSFYYSYLLFKLTCTSTNMSE